MATVRLDHVLKTYKTRAGLVRAVDDLQLEVADHEFLVLVGPSGCGKTTTLRLIAGLEEPTAGSVHIDERDVTRVAPKDRDVAMVFQNYALYPHMTVFQNMAFGLKMRRVPKPDIRLKVHETATMLGITDLLDRKPASLSGGQQQRVAVGRAIVRRPKVFLFDEPLAALDAGLRLRMRAEMKSLHRDLQATMIYVTHDQEEAMTLGSRIAVMKEGVLQQCGTPLEVYRRPANRFVAGFLGTPPMNFLEGRLTDGAVCLDCGELHGSEPDTGHRALRRHHGQRIVLGVRPQHVRLTATSANPTANVEPHPSRPEPDDGMILRDLSVQMVAPLGDCVDVHLRTPSGGELIARLPANASITPGDRATAQCLSSDVHFFAVGGNGERLPTENAPG